MRTEMIGSSKHYSSGYGAGSGDIERYEFECPCKKGKIVEVHDNIPGFRDHNVYMDCDKCEQAYQLDKSNGVRNWRLVSKD